MLLVNKIFSVTETAMHDNFNEIESAWTCCKLGTQNFCSGIIYRPQNSADIYIQKLLDQLSYMCDYHYKYSVIICGDFNFPNINWKIPCPIVNDSNVQILRICNGHRINTSYRF